MIRLSNLELSILAYFRTCELYAVDVNQADLFMQIGVPAPQFNEALDRLKELGLVLDPVRVVVH